MKDINYLIEKDKIIEAINNLFIHTDNKDWNKVKKCFSDKVHFDMSSAGGSADIITPDKIIGVWKEGLNPIDQVHHQAGNYKVSIDNDEARAFCYGIAVHYRNINSGNSTRTFTGSYDFYLIKKENEWLIEKFKFNLKFITGNINLEKEN